MFKQSENLKKTKKKKKNVFLLVFQYKEDTIRPELSSPALFRIQGGSPDRDRAGAAAGVVEVAGQYFSFLILDGRKVA